MPKEIAPIRSIETKGEKIAYAVEFRQMLREHPGIIKTAIELTDKAVAEYNPSNVMIDGKEFTFKKAEGIWVYKKAFSYSEGRKLVTGEDETRMDFGRGTILVAGKPITDEKTGLKITVIGRSNRVINFSQDNVRLDKCDYLKMSVGRESFFVKRSFISINPGFTEFKNTISAEQALKDLKFVKVVSAKLGYQDKKESWYISSWEDLEKKGFVILDENQFKSTKEHQTINRRADMIESRLEEVGYQCDLIRNLFYSHKNKTFILLDVTSEYDQEKALGQAIRSTNNDDRR